MKTKEDTNRMSEVAESQLNLELKRIGEWLETLRFRKQFIGGVSQEDVWKKIQELNAMYQEALKAERIRYDTLMEHYRKEGERKAAKDIP